MQLGSPPKKAGADLNRSEPWMFQILCSMNSSQGFHQDPVDWSSQLATSKEENMTKGSKTKKPRLLRRVVLLG